MKQKIKALEAFWSNNEYNNFIYPISLKNAKNIKKNNIFLKLLPVEELANKLHIDTKKVLKQINKMLDKQFILRDLLSYEYFPTDVDNSRGILVAKKCASSCSYSNVKHCVEEKFYDVYLVCNSNINVTFNIIFRTLLAEMFPHLFIKNEENGFLFKEDFKYNKEQRNCLEKLSKELQISNIPIELRDLSIKDINYCLNNKKRINEIVYKTRISSYFDSDCIYIHLFNVNINGFIYERDLYVPIEALFTKDYEAIANEYITSQAIINDKKQREFVNGKQKDMPYFNNERTQKILTYILK